MKTFFTSAVAALGLALLISQAPAEAQTTDGPAVKPAPSTPVTSQPLPAAAPAAAAASTETASQNTAMSGDTSGGAGAANDPTAPLTWGADADSGAPYVFQDPNDPKRIIGYEYDIMAAIGKKLGRESKFIQNGWDNLIPGLTRGQYLAVIDGLVITKDRQQAVDFSIPYYTTFEQIVVRKGDEQINSLDAMKGHTVGTLKATVAQQMLEKHGGINVRTYDEEINAYSDLQNGRLDAVLLDAPIAIYYAANDPALQLVGKPVGRLHYGIAIDKENTQLLHQINNAILEIQKSGEMRQILEKWNLWSDVMATELGQYGGPSVPPTAYNEYVQATAPATGFWGTLHRYWSFQPLLAHAAWLTLQISVLAMVIAVGLGLMLALTRLYMPAPLSYLSIAYIEVVRGTPLLIQILFIFYGLPNLGIKLDPFVAGTLALGLNYAAYEAENYRAGLQAIPKGQMEAAIALNMTHGQALRHVMVPQAGRHVLPVMTNDFISLLKDSSLVSVITMVELTQTYIQLSTTYFDYFGTGILVAIWYLLLGLPFVWLARYLEHRMTPKSTKPAGPTPPDVSQPA